MKDITCQIISNKRIADCIFEMKLKGNIPKHNPGQFINIKVKNCYLRRPISVCNYDNKTMTIIYKIVGQGTNELSLMKKNDRINILTNLGNGYYLSLSGDNPLVIGGGVGIPPLYYLCIKLIEKGIIPKVILGYNTINDAFYVEEFRKLGVSLHIVTQDKSLGEKGLVTDILKTMNDYSYIYTCGPEKMLKAVFDLAKTSGQYSFESRMGCGFGACMSCSCKTKYGYKRICRDGPVLESEEIIW